jgi:hypothetical protein
MSRLPSNLGLLIASRHYLNGIFNNFLRLLSYNPIKIAEVIREVKRTLSGLIFTSEGRGFYMTQEYCWPRKKGTSDASRITSASAWVTRLKENNCKK